MDSFVAAFGLKDFKKVQKPSKMRLWAVEVAADIATRLIGSVFIVRRIKNTWDAGLIPMTPFDKVGWELLSDLHCLNHA